MTAPSESGRDRGISADERVMRAMGGGKLIGAKTGQNIVVVPANPEVSRFVESLPRLFGDDHRIRFNPFNGEVWMSSYPDSKEIIASPRQVIKEAGQGKEKVVAQAWSRSSDIVTAISRAQQIAQKTEPQGGDVVIKTKKLMGALYALIPQYRQGNITKEDLPNVQAEMDRVLIESGYKKARKPNKQVAAQKAIQAVTEDPRGFINSLIGRTVAASAIKYLAADLIDARFTNQKYTRLAARLTIENDHKRFIQQEAVEMIKVLENLPSGHKEFSQEILALKDFFNQFLGPVVIKAAPYRVPVIISRVNLFGFLDFGDKRFVQRVLGKDSELFDKLARQKNIFELLGEMQADSSTRDISASEIKMRIFESREYIEIGLEIGQDRSQPSTEVNKQPNKPRKRANTELFWEEVEEKLRV